MATGRIFRRRILRNASCSWGTCVSSVVPNDPFIVCYEAFSWMSESSFWWKPFGQLVEDNSKTHATTRGDKIIDFDARITRHRNMEEQKHSQ